MKDTPSRPRHQNRGSWRGVVSRGKMDRRAKMSTPTETRMVTVSDPHVRLARIQKRVAVASDRRSLRRSLLRGPRQASNHEPKRSTTVTVASVFVGRQWHVQHIARWRCVGSGWKVGGVPIGNPSQPAPLPPGLKGRCRSVSPKGSTSRGPGHDKANHAPPLGIV